jgi:acetyl-CoA acetyltransferase
VPIYPSHGSPCCATLDRSSAQREIDRGDASVSLVGGTQKMSSKPVGLWPSQCHQLRIRPSRSPVSTNLAAGDGAPRSATPYKKALGAPRTTTVCTKEVQGTQLCLGPPTI